MMTLRFSPPGLLQSAHYSLGGLPVTFYTLLSLYLIVSEDRVGFWLWACVVDGNLFPPSYLLKTLRCRRAVLLHLARTLPLAGIYCDSPFIPSYPLGLRYLTRCGSPPMGGSWESNSSIYFSLYISIYLITSSPPIFPPNSTAARQEP